MPNPHPLRRLLAPLSWLYGMGTSVRNLLYDKGLLRSYSFGTPVVVIGNLLAGGTGKTPVVAWLAKELGKEYRIAVLSRGYGRKTRGFRLVTAQSSPRQVGDEPLELKLGLPDTLIAVDRNRVRGIRKLTSGLFGPLDLILMDDGFQHRRVKPGFAVILDNARRPAASEPLLPVGLRRESLKALRRANLVVTTRVEADTSALPADAPLILVTGIAHPEPLAAQLRQTHTLLHHLQYPDHHPYTPNDLAYISSLCPCALVPPCPSAPVPLCPSAPVPLCPILVTTAKDFTKLRLLPGAGDLPIHVLPVHHGIEPDIARNLLNTLRTHVEQNR